MTSHSPSASSSSVKESYDVDALITYIQYRAVKMVSVQTLLPQILFVVALLVISNVFLQSPTSNAVSFSVDQSSEVSIAFRAISQYGDWYNWTETFYAQFSSLHSSISQGNLSTKGFRYPVAGLFIRHYVEEPKECSRNPLHRRLAAMDPSFNDSNNYRCRGSTAKSPSRAPLKPLNTTPVPGGLLFNSSAWSGPNPTFSNSLSPLLWKSMRGTLGTATDWNSALFLPYNVTDLPAYGFSSDWVEELRLGQWLREKTILVSNEIVLYHAEQDIFVLHTLIIEPIQGGHLRATTTHMPFNVLLLKSPRDYALLALFVFVAVLWLFQIVEFFYRVSVKAAFADSWADGIEFSDLFLLGSIGVGGACLGLYFYLFYAANALNPGPSDPAVANLTFLVGIARWTDTAQILLAWMQFTALCRVFMFLRYCTRLSLVNESLISSVHDFVGLGFVCLIVLCAYSLTGHMLWYHTNTAYQTFGGSLMNLFNLMISLEINDYETLQLYNPKSTLLFFVTFFILVWCLILNTLVGVLATSFASALDTQTFTRRPDWSLSSLFRDARSLLGRCARPSASTGGRRGGIDTSLTQHRLYPAHEIDAIWMRNTLNLSPELAGPQTKPSFLFRFFSSVTPNTVIASVAIAHHLRYYLYLQAKVREVYLENVDNPVQRANSPDAAPTKAEAEHRENSPLGNQLSRKEVRERMDSELSAETLAAEARPLLSSTEFDHSREEKALPRYGATPQEKDHYRKAARLPLPPRTLREATTVRFGYISLQALQMWTGLSQETSRRLGKSSIQLAGLHDVKLREWRLLQKAVEGGHDMTTRLTNQYRQLHSLHDQLCSHSHNTGPGPQAPSLTAPDGAEQDDVELNEDVGSQEDDVSSGAISAQVELELMRQDMVELNARVVQFLRLKRADDGVAKALAKFEALLADQPEKSAAQKKDD